MNNSGDSETASTEARVSGRPSTAVTWAALVTAMTLGLAIIGGATSILNWLYQENNRLRSEIIDTRLAIARDQVTRSEFRDVLKELVVRIDGRLDRIENRLGVGSAGSPASPR